MNADKNGLDAVKGTKIHLTLKGTLSKRGADSAAHWIGLGFVIVCTAILLWVLFPNGIYQP